MTKQTCIARKLGFPEVIMPGKFSFFSLLLREIIVPVDHPVQPAKVLNLRSMSFLPDLKMEGKETRLVLCKKIKSGVLLELASYSVIVTRIDEF